MATATAPDAVPTALTTTDRFLVQQVFRPVANQYRISVPASGTAEEGEPLLFVKQKVAKIKEDIRFRTDDGDGPELFRIASKTVFEFRGRHDVLDAGGQVIGTIEKEFARSLLRSRWIVRDAQGAELFAARETSRPIAFIRRLGDLVPEAFGLLHFLPFDFTLLRGEDEVARYRRVLPKLRDRYVLELGPGLADVDRRLLLAFAIALDALQDR
ncbi:LURP-one-related/scramblase family protein [Patulibacter americanus]|uniref:LURP-one-related/scramblase family protein n=1 Tax=Patulibacter americanus TaxID=588672 RepID=UPI0003B520DE|nr:hypothetical protein [Patulibacter americanus]